jgi:hypothetical protein
MYYDRQGKQLTMQEWSELFRNEGYKRVKSDYIPQPVGELWISTVWLGLDHGYGQSAEPLIFETMIFNKAKSGMSELYCARYSEEESALEGHAKAVELAKAGEFDKELSDE